MRKARYLTVVVIVALCTTLWWPRTNGPTVVDAALRLGSTESTNVAGESSPTERNKEESVRESLSAAKTWLAQISVSDDGVAATGRIRWRGVRLPTAIALKELDDPRCGQTVPIDARGSISVQVPAGSWLLGRFECEDDEQRCDYVVLSSQWNGRTFTLDLDPKRGRLHVFVVEMASGATAAGQRIHVSRAGTSAAPQIVMSGEAGYVVVDHVQRGAIHVSLSSPERGGSPGRTLVLGGSSAIISLRRPPASVALELTVDVMDPNSDPRGTRFLFLRGGPGKDVYPVRTPLKQGRQRVRVSVPLGAYEIGAVPFFASEVEVVGGSLAVFRANQTARVVVRSKPKVGLKLRGIARKEFPVTVIPRKAWGMGGESRSSLYVGPYWWHSDGAQVGAGIRGQRLIVLGRGRFWVTGEPAERAIGGRELSVELRSACRLQIVARIGEDDLGARCVLRTREFGDEEVALEVRQDGGGGVILRGEAVVLPGERANVILMSSKGGEILASERVDVGDGPTEHVILERR